MKILSFKANRLGPYYHEFAIDLDRQVTILTGANDVGKTSLLRALELAVSDQRFAEEEFVNADHLHESQRPWSSDRALTVEVLVALDQPADLQGGNVRIAEGDTIQVKREVSKEINRTHFVTRTKAGANGDHPWKWPAVIKPGGANVIIGDQLNLVNPNPLEQRLLTAAFKKTFNFETLKGLSGLRYTREVEAAQVELNRLLNSVMPRPSRLQFQLSPIEGKRDVLGVYVRDHHGGLTPFGNRGSGVRRIVALMAEVLTYAEEHHRVILLDEPETSLHADAQHLFREFLYQLTADGKTQVVYATHSPCMINTLRPTQLRLLGREERDGVALTVLKPLVSVDNLRPIRSSLGLSLADSLLYGPVTIVTEGETEMSGLIPLMRRMAKSGRPEFEDLDRILGSCHLLNGAGDNFALICKVAQSHDAGLVIFLDGDKRRKVVQLGVDKLGVEIVFTSGESEFEELVPAEDYVRAIYSLQKVEMPADALDRLAAWVEGNPRRSKQAFSKRVEFWVRETCDVLFPSKPDIMLEAIARVDPARVVVQPLIELLEAIRRVLKGTSFE
jgi:energy-coupling factor transporter ATP-binding protein EcfA2